MPINYSISILKNKKTLQKKILKWFDSHKRDLPWRRTKDPYAIWISEFMLQQTQVEQVIPYYHRFLKRFPDVFSLANASLDNVMKVWEGMGYYRRAKYLYNAAKIIVSEYKGIVPNDYEALRQLPGFGNYTTGSVLSIAYNQPYPAVDGNVIRVAARLLKITKVIDTTIIKKIITPFIFDLIPDGKASDFNQALMELGALVCRPAKPDCRQCCWKHACLAFHEMNDPSVLPKRKKKIRGEIRHIAVAVVVKNRKILIARRPDNVILGNLWEFPGGKQKKEESIEDACLREVREETGITIRITNPIMSFKHHYSHYSIVLHFFYGRYLGGRLKNRKTTKLRWVPMQELTRFAFPKANQRVISRIFEDYGVSD
ncbi:A/G-specific adenine glycosylase [bacterium]|nr:A/G-specific adenine glycosylase [bacterium]